MTREPQWLVLGRDAAARALYETWHPTRTDNGWPDGAQSWKDLDEEARRRYLDAAQLACSAFHESTYESARAAIEALRR